MLKLRQMMNQIMKENLNWDSMDEQSFQEWMEDGNVIKNSDGTYSTQDAQWRNKLKDLNALKQYFAKEFLQ